MAVPLLDIKLFATLALFILTIVCCVAPWGLRSLFNRSLLKAASALSSPRKNNNSSLSVAAMTALTEQRERVSSRWRKTMSLLYCLAGGVVLGSLLMHMIPELGHQDHLSAVPVAHHHDGHNHDHHEHHDHVSAHNPSHEHQLEYPWASFFAGVSFLGLLFIDRLFMSHPPHPTQHPKQLLTEGQKHESHGRKQEDSRPDLGLQSPKDDDSLLVPELYPRVIECNDHEHSHSTCTSSKKCDDDPQHKHRDHLHHHHSESGHCNHEHEHHKFPSSADASSASFDLEKLASSESIALCSGGGCQMHGIEGNPVSTVVFVIALSVHSFLEGLGMASKKTQGDLTSFLISLFAHKWIEAFALGAAVMGAGFSSTAFVSLLLFAYSAFTPLGCLLGILGEHLLLQASSHTPPKSLEFLRAFCNGSAMGSFLFVACLEMIPPQFPHASPITSHTYARFGMLAAGFGVMALVASYHSH